MCEESVVSMILPNHNIFHYFIWECCVWFIPIFPDTTRVWNKGFLSLCQTKCTVILWCIEFLHVVLSPMVFWTWCPHHGPSELIHSILMLFVLCIFIDLNICFMATNVSLMHANTVLCCCNMFWYHLLHPWVDPQHFGHGLYKSIWFTLAAKLL